MPISNNNQFFDYWYLKVLSKETLAKLGNQESPCEVEYEDFVIYMNDYFKQADTNNQIKPGQFNFLIRTTYNTMKIMGLLVNSLDWKPFIPLLIVNELEAVNNIEFGEINNDNKEN